MQQPHKVYEDWRRAGYIKKFVVTIFRSPCDREKKKSVAKTGMKEYSSVVVIIMQQGSNRFPQTKMKDMTRTYPFSLSLTQPCFHKVIFTVFIHFFFLSL